MIASPDGWQKPSTSYRMRPLARAGYQATAIATGTFPTASQISDIVAASTKRPVLILRRVLPTEPQLAELMAAFSHVIFDIDDAIHVVAPRLDEAPATRRAKRLYRRIARGSAVASPRARELKRVLRSVDACVVGNTILAEFARAHARHVVEIPTTTEPVSRVGAFPRRELVIVWLGVRANLQYLDMIAGALKQIGAQRHAKLRIVTSGSVLPDYGLTTEAIAWSPEAARHALLTASVGIAPLTDDPWTRGKCAFRAIQYGAHRLPTVASPVGVTDQVVIHGETGYLPRADEQWLGFLDKLLSDPREVAQMGAQALDMVWLRYSDEVAATKWESLLASL